MRKTLLLMIFMLMPFIFVHAQTASSTTTTNPTTTDSSTASTSTIPKVELFGGYSYLGTEFGRGVNGGNLSITGNINKYFGVEADVAGYTTNGDAIGTLMAGPRFSYRLNNDKVNIFGHALFGGVAPDAAFAMAFGGGVDLKVHKNIAIRLFQADYIQFRQNGFSSNNARFSTGIVFYFGKK